MQSGNAMKENTQPIRLSPNDKTNLLETLKTELIKQGGGQVWLFGSRVNLKAKGGDIDLYTPNVQVFGLLK